MKNVLLIVCGLGVAFGAGYVPQYMNAARIAEELEQASSGYETRLMVLEDENRVLGLQRDLGTLLLEVEDQNYGRARELSTRFFDQLAEAAGATSNEDVRRVLASLSRQRDTVTSMLTEANAETASQVRQMYQTLANAPRAN